MRDARAGKVRFFSPWRSNFQACTLPTSGPTATFYNLKRSDPYIYSRAWMLIDARARALNERPTFCRQHFPVVGDRSAWYLLHAPMHSVVTLWGSRELLHLPQAQLYRSVSCNLHCRLGGASAPARTAASPAMTRSSRRRARGGVDIALTRSNKF